MMLGEKTPPEVLQSEVFCRSRKFSFDINRYRLPHGAIAQMGCIRHPGGALAVPLTREGQLVLVRQYRFAAEQSLLEFPAGTVEISEPPNVTIQRELEEEAGYRAHHWRSLGEFYVAPGYSNEIIYAFLATDLEKLENPPPQDDDEDIEAILMTPLELEAAILKGQVVDAKTISSFFLARPFLT